MPRKLIPAALALGLVLAACGGSSDPSAGTDAKRVEVEMVDIAFEPTQLSVTKGETVTLVFKNTGKLKHEAYVGTMAEQAEHAKEMMASKGGHGGGHGAENKVTVDPGKSATLKHTFDQAGTYEIGCHQPGHYEAGMKINVAVA